MKSCSSEFGLHYPGKIILFLSGFIVEQEIRTAEKLTRLEGENREENKLGAISFANSVLLWKHVTWWNKQASLSLKSFRKKQLIQLCCQMQATIGFGVCVWDLWFCLYMQKKAATYFIIAIAMASDQFMFHGIYFLIRNPHKFWEIYYSSSHSTHSWMFEQKMSHLLPCSSSLQQKPVPSFLINCHSFFRGLQLGGLFRLPAHECSRPGWFHFLAGRNSTGRWATKSVDFIVGHNLREPFIIRARGGSCNFSSRNLMNFWSVKFKMQTRPICTNRIPPEKKGREKYFIWHSFFIISVVLCRR